MKTLLKLCFLCSLLFSLPLAAATLQQQIAVVWVTNTAGNSSNITFNGTDTRTAWNTVTNANTQWQTTNSAAATATNLLAHLSAYPPLGLASYTVQWSGTNTAAFWIVAPTGSNITASVIATWARITYVTNTYASSTNVVVPVASMPANSRSNITSGLIEWLNQNPAAAGHFISNNAAAFARFLSDKTNAQSFTNKVFRDAVLHGAALNQATLTNSALGGTVFMSTDAAGISGNFLWDSVWNLSVDPDTYQLVFADVGTGEAAFRLGTSQNIFIAPTVFSNAVSVYSDLFLAGGLTLEDTILGPNANFTTNTAFLSFITGTAIVARASIGTSVIGTLGVTGAVSSLSVTATSSITSATGTITGPLTVGSLKALGTNSLNGLTTNSGAILHRSFAISTLAAGNNIITRPTNNLVFFSATAGAATLCAITNGFGDGDWFDAVNDTGYALTVASESGFTAIPANRIRCVNGASNVTVFPGGNLRLSYSASAARWLLLYPEVFNAVATNAIASVNGTGSNIFLIAPVFAASATDTNTTNGHVWTATGTNGAGYWSAPATGGDAVLSNIVNAANIALSNLAYAIGLAGTNYTLAIVTNYITTASGTGTNTVLYKFIASSITGASNDALRVNNTNGHPTFQVLSNGVVRTGTNGNGLTISNSAVPGFVALIVSNAVPIIQINGAGNMVGIGKTPSSYALEIQGSMTATANIESSAGNAILRGGVGSKFYVNGFGYIQFPTTDGKMLIGRDAGGQGDLSYVSNILASATITATNGFASYATKTNITVSSTGLTNATGHNIRIIGITGVSLNQTVNSTNTYSLGTITVPTHLVLQNGEYITGTSVAIQGSCNSF